MAPLYVVAHEFDRLTRKALERQYDDLSMSAEDILACLDFTAGRREVVKGGQVEVVVVPESDPRLRSCLQNEHPHSWSTETRTGMSLPAR